MKKHTQVFAQGKRVKNFSQLQLFLKSPGCPKVSGQTDRHTDIVRFIVSSTEVENIKNTLTTDWRELIQDVFVLVLLSGMLVDIYQVVHGYMQTLRRLTLYSNSSHSPVCLKKCEKVDRETKFIFLKFEHSMVDQL